MTNMNCFIGLRSLRFMHCNVALQRGCCKGVDRRLPTFCCAQSVQRSKAFGGSHPQLSRGPCSAAHAAMPEQRFHTRLPSTESDKRLERWAAAAHTKDLVPEALAGGAVEHAVLLEQAVSVSRQHLSPLIAVVARGISAGEDMGKVMWKAVVWRWEHHRDLSPNL